MSLENADAIADLLGQTEQLVGGSDVGGNAKVRLLQVHQTEKVGRQRSEIGIFRALSVGLISSCMHGCGHDRGWTRPVLV